MPESKLTTTEIRIANRLRIRRKLLGISAEKIAFINQLSADEYHRFETAKQRIDPPLLKELAFLLNVPVAYFFEPRLKNDPS